MNKILSHSEISFTEAFSNRLEHIVKGLGLTAHAVEVKSGVTRGVVQKCIANKTSMNVESVGKILSTFVSIDARELLTGIPQNSGNNKKNIKDFDSERDTNAEIIFLRGQVSELTGIISNLSRVLNSKI